jgi:hypothetical protein
MVTFTGSFGPVSAQQLAALEKTLSVKLPAAYKKFLRTTNGGMPNPDCFTVPDHGDALCGVLFGIRDERRAADLEWEQEQAKQWDPLPRGFVAIGRDPGGNLLLLSTSGEQAGVVFYWDRKGFWVRKRGANTFPIAKSFTAFVAGLHEMVNESKSDEEPSKPVKGRRTRRRT